MLLSYADFDLLKQVSISIIYIEDVFNRLHKFKTGASTEISRLSDVAAIKFTITALTSALIGVA